ncbi:MAG: VOC family protein [Alphaproteobacteria bacterium]|uniref:VOC family protein n=1 Tax=Maricaulis alexandrii TaxID=2570354 RepID=UPI0011090F5D|nr:VOC family protein [Maricaulis alexandrii]MCR9266153.1 VOC family protein [Alphaproteobacteria bacterium]
MADKGAAEGVRPSVYGFGIGVSDLERSNAFYTELLGMKRVMDFSLSHMDEIVLLYPDGGSSLVLMHWTDGSTRDYSNNPVKIVVRLEDPKAAADRIREAGYRIIREPEPAPEVGGFVVGFAKDPDGYLVELLDAKQS